MKVQYFGDVNDYRKFALLRLFARTGGFRIGVCWMLTPADGRPDGKKRSYLEQPGEWSEYDPPLFELLRTVKPMPELSDLLRIENEGVILNARFFNRITPDDRAGRLSFHQACLSDFAQCELAFFDPDNGLDRPSFPQGRTNSSKYAYADELAEHYGFGRSVLIYQHYPREPRETFLTKTASRLAENLPGVMIWSFHTADVAFLLAARPEHADRIATSLGQMANEWPTKFIKPQRHEVA